MAKVLLYGYYGLNNVGDDYILLSVINSIRFNNNEITVLSFHSQYNDLSFKANEHIKILPTNKILRQIFIINEIRKCDYFIIGGGGLWTNDSLRQVFINYMWVLFAKILNTKCAFYGIEITPIRNNKVKKIWKKIILNTDFIISRNGASKKLLDDISDGFSNKIKAYSDVTFSITNEDISSFRKLEHKIHHIRYYKVWSIAMPWDENELKDIYVKRRYQIFIDQLVALSKKLDEVFPNTVNVFIPFNKSRDMIIANDLVSRIDNSVVFLGDWTYSRYLFADAKFAVCMRFHSVLFAIYELCDFIAISYSPKTTDLLNELNCPLYVEYGIRNSTYFYKEFDMNLSELFLKLNEISDWERKKKRIRNSLIYKSNLGTKDLYKWIIDK